MAIKCHHFPIQNAPKFTQIGIFGSKKSSGNPGSPKILFLLSEMRQKFDNGEDPLDPESQQGQGNPFHFHNHPFGGGGGPFQFKFHFN
jgi:hypothetical protein